MMTDVCIIADTHRQHRSLTIPQCDVLIHCGDFCSFQQEDTETLEDADDWFAELRAAGKVRHIVCIGGNHDFLLQSREFRFAHAEYVEDRLVEFAGLKIYGSPWCPDLRGFAFYAPEAELRQRWQGIPAGTDILVTHTPPHGILDRPTSGDVHLGCPHLLRAVRSLRPRLHVFGHVHASHGRQAEGGTVFYNTAVVGGRDYRVVHGPTLHVVEAG